MNTSRRMQASLNTHQAVAWRLYRRSAGCCQGTNSTLERYAALAMSVIRRFAAVPLVLVLVGLLRRRDVEPRPRCSDRSGQYRVHRLGY